MANVIIATNLESRRNARASSSSSSSSESGGMEMYASQPNAGLTGEKWLGPNFPLFACTKKEIHKIFLLEIYCNLYHFALHAVCSRTGGNDMSIRARFLSTISLCLLRARRQPGSPAAQQPSSSVDYCYYSTRSLFDQRNMVKTCVCTILRTTTKNKKITCSLWWHLLAIP